ncbi:hypothetical protein FQR65_LT02655 [Abscondita terminalis]|nr:hypothetical protein FQR65_LT02655 [Abscondita terminalis]
MLFLNLILKSFILCNPFNGSLLHNHEIVNCLIFDILILGILKFLILLIIEFLG